jgi:hypothetical protein
MFATNEFYLFQTELTGFSAFSRASRREGRMKSTAAARHARRSISRRRKNVLSC